ncbi:MAG: DUF3367 domain-containing protein [Streptomyces sp.]|uniref:alpha-(1->3)-arabinofuranosyltransferase n=1 Tax=Streptomyces sp. TaxID=1931 RepID=UPI0025E22B1F|nr:alpha-(1->3)-arabinofuranosyltransferase [Streptomyces sp.]MBW8801259.1 DUF3367 domain-containing protein [Streptomyces sp.]
MIDSTPRSVVRLRQAAVCLLLVVLAFHQSAGLIGNDTKLDLTADPGRFLRRALDLWNPSSAGGQLQNQAYGYLFPMGTFHLLGSVLGLPDWVVQRLWMSLLLVAAFLGVLRLAGRLQLGTPTTRLLGGLAYALAPRVLTEIGGNSSEILPFAVLPWVLVPLVGAAAEQRPRRAAARSGLAVLCMGAVNATAVLALLPLPLLWLVPGLSRSSGRRLAAWWAVAVTLACTWWFVPLLLQGRYSPDFLDYIETAATTTSTTSPGEVLRGTSHWLGYVSSGGSPWWRSGWALVTNTGAVLNTGVLSVLCVAGLVRRRMPGQGRLAAAAALGLLAMSAVHAGPLDGPLVGFLRDLLDGALAPFRNVHKFDALVRLPLALGLCHLLARAPTLQARRALTGLVTLALVGCATPALAGQLVPSGGYEQLPSWWRATGQWLDDHDATGRAMVVPASGFGEYLWGRPLDNPLQALTRGRFVVRDAVPLGSAGTTRLLDAVEARLDSGRGSPGMAAVLARSGVHYLVVSNDLDPVRTGAPRPALVHQALAQSPGLTRVAAFGPTVGGDKGASRALVSDHGLSLGYPAVEVYAVAGAQPPAVSLPKAGTWLVSGGPESLFQLADRGLLGDEATVLVGDGSAGPSPRSAVTDALRRREVNFGQVRDNASATLTADQQLTRHQAVPDELPVPGVQHLAVARLLGADAVTASTSASDPGAVLDRAPEHSPFSAVDGDPSTAWVTGSLAGAAGQWVQLDLDRPVDPTGTTVQQLLDAQVKGTVREVTVSTDRGQRTTRIAGDESVQRVAVPAGSTRHLRVTLTQVDGDGYGVLAGLRSIDVPGVVVQQTVVLPDDQALTADGVVLVDRAVGGRSACVTDRGRTACAPGLARSGEDAVRLDRTFSLPAERTLAVSGSAVADPGPQLDALLDRGAGVQATASSRLVSDPRERPSTVLDSDRSTGWVAGPEDPRPTLTLTWAGARQLDRLSLVTDASLAAARPTRVKVVTDSGSTALDVPADGILPFPGVRTTHLEVQFLAWEKRSTVAPDGTTNRLPVGVSELEVPALDDLTSAPPPETVSIPCGEAPPVLVDGQVHATTVLARRDDLLVGRPVLLGLCDLAAGLRLGPGEHRVVGAERAGVQVQGLTLGSPLPTPAATARPTTVRSWGSEHRTVDIGTGAATYLVVHENHNAGWHATLAGKELNSARVDGWQQAWVVPAGAGGQVRLDFSPGRTFHFALVVGGLLVLLLVVLALAPARVRELPQPQRRDLDLPQPVRVVLGLGFVVLLGGVVGGLLYAVALGAVLVGSRVVGPDRTSDAAVGGYGIALTCAAALTALSPWNGPRTPAAFGRPVQLLALAGLAAAAAAVTVLRSSNGASAPAPGAPRTAGSVLRRRSSAAPPEP